jgi:hypothetical protein
LGGGDGDVGDDGFGDGDDDGGGGCASCNPWLRNPCYLLFVTREWRPYEEAVTLFLKLEEDIKLPLVGTSDGRLTTVNSEGLGG